MSTKKAHLSPLIPTSSRNKTPGSERIYIYIYIQRSESPEVGKQSTRLCTRQHGVNQARTASRGRGNLSLGKFWRYVCSRSSLRHVALDAILKRCIIGPMTLNYLTSSYGRCIRAREVGWKVLWNSGGWIAGFVANWLWNDVHVEWWNKKFTLCSDRSIAHQRMAAIGNVMQNIVLFILLRMNF